MLHCPVLAVRLSSSFTPAHPLARKPPSEPGMNKLGFLAHGSSPRVPTLPHPLSSIERRAGAAAGGPRSLPPQAKDSQERRNTQRERRQARADAPIPPQWPPSPPPPTRPPNRARVDGTGPDPAPDSHANGCGQAAPTRCLESPPGPPASPGALPQVDTNAPSQPSPQDDGRGGHAESLGIEHPCPPRTRRRHGAGLPPAPRLGPGTRAGRALFAVTTRTVTRTSPAR